MRPKLFHALCAVMLSSAFSVAVADDDIEAPERVGRISTLSGPVLLRAGDGEAQTALLNWPITSDNRITTERNGLAELRVGAVAVRLDADSELDVSQLDDDSFRLHLSYGSVSVRVRDSEALRGFELTTAQARVSLREPGWVRVEAERPAGVSVISVLDGRAEVDGSMASITVQAGKRVELSNDGLNTGPLQRIAFDDWPESLPSAAPALRYVTQDMTGYEELDRYGAWQDSTDYGPLWLPRTVPVGWAPYSDGRWSWIAPWGWTWIDNAPWGYAPSHYGRWVLVGKRWGWAPGRERVRGAWAPALVGWVGGNHPARPGQHAGPGVGWFPLSPRDHYVPGYRVRSDYAWRVNRMAEGRRQLPGERERREGLTMLPGQPFGPRRTVDVPRGSHVTLPAPQLTSLPLTTAPPGQPQWQRPQGERRNDAARPAWASRPGRLQTETLDARDDDRSGRPGWRNRQDGQAPVFNPAPPRPPQARPPMVTAPAAPVMPAAPPTPAAPPAPAMPAVPALLPVQDHVRPWRSEREGREGRPVFAPSEQIRPERREPRAERPEPRPPRPEARPEARPEMRPDVRPESRPEPRPEPRPEVRPEPRPAPRAERPEPRPERVREAREPRENREQQRPQNNRVRQVEP